MPSNVSGYAVVVSKKVARLSVTRHRIKRQILSILRSFPELPEALIVFPKASAFQLDLLHIQADLTNLFSKIPHSGRFNSK